MSYCFGHARLLAGKDTRIHLASLYHIMHISWQKNPSSAPQNTEWLCIHGSRGDTVQRPDTGGLRAPVSESVLHPSTGSSVTPTQPWESGLFL